MSGVTLTSDSGILLVNYKNFLPCGAMVNFAGTTAPTGWLICDGRLISRSTYSDLFDIIGTTYGFTTNENFNLPDLGERIPVGYKSGTNSLGNTGGNNSVTLTTNQIPSHTHSGTVASNGDHTHTGTSDSNGSHTHTASDSGHNHSYNDAYFAENRGGGTNVYGTGSGTDGDNDYYYRTPTPTTSNGFANITVANNGVHTHSFTTETNGSHSHGITIGNTGSGQSIDIRNKFIVLNYIIKH
jgi:microcystin-dependent protein